MPEQPVTKTHHFEQKVLFRHCDPAGIVFFPRYYEMINDCIEDWFASATGMPWEELHRTNAVPTLNIETTFTAPSRHGDVLDLALNTTKVGTTSLGLQIVGSGGGRQRFVSRSSLVHVDTEVRPAPWSDDMRAIFKTFLI